ncbi:MAG: energy transducer TonB [Bacteroidetes bacterium]|nr:energy transducer TonB [Bacteroidota bacterium]
MSEKKELFNEWTNVVSSTRNELVFEGRNKSYGAFVIRREYNKTASFAVLVTSLAFVLLVAAPKIIQWIGSQQEEEIITPVDLTTSDLEAPPPVDETEPPPPPPPPPPVMETVKFTPPVVVDEEVPEEELPPPQETETQISTVTQEGTGGDEIIIPEEGDGVVEAVAEEVFTIVEEMPSFPGGEAEMQKFIQKNVSYPQMEKEAGIQGTVYVSFVVEKDGQITDAKILRGVSGGKGCDNEALRVIKAMPGWKAGKQNGRSVRVQFNVPIRFTLR